MASAGFAPGGETKRRSTSLGRASPRSTARKARRRAASKTDTSSARSDAAPFGTTAPALQYPDVTFSTCHSNAGSRSTGPFVSPRRAIRRAAIVGGASTGVARSSSVDGAAVPWNLNCRSIAPATRAVVPNTTMHSASASKRWIPDRVIVSSPWPMTAMDLLRTPESRQSLEAAPSPVGWSPPAEVGRSRFR